jgi:Tfp pilus assembly protein PilP
MKSPFRLVCFVLLQGMFFSYVQAWAQTAGAQPAAQAPPTSAPAQEVDRASTVKRFSSVRDPFKKPDSVIPKLDPKSELEQFAVDEIKLIGILTGPKQMRAMVRTPDGKSFVITENMKIGQRNGIVKRITPKAVVVQEKIVNVLGEEEYFEAEISMNPAAEAGQGSERTGK